MRTLTREQEQRHAQACQLVDLPRDLTEEERRFILDNWQESSTNRNASDRAYFTPAGIAGDIAIDARGAQRIIDLAAGIGRLAFHCRRTPSDPDRPSAIVCVERNPEYVRVGQRVLPEATWICGDILDLPDQHPELGDFDLAVSNPPYGPVPRHRDARGRYTGRRFEYHTIVLAGLLASRGLFVIPQTSAPFRLSGQPALQRHSGDDEYQKFAAVTGLRLEPNCGTDTTSYQHDWREKCPLVEIVKVDYTQRVAPVPPPLPARQSRPPGHRSAYVPRTARTSHTRRSAQSPRSEANGQLALLSL